MSDRVNPAGGLRGEFRPSYRPAKPPASVLPDLRGLGIVAVCVGGVVAAAATVVTLFSHHHAGVPVIEAPAGPVRVKPADAGGMKLSGADLGVGAGAAQALAPPPEQPQIKELRAQLQAVRKLVARQAAENAATAKLAAQASKIMTSPPPAQASATLREPVPAPMLPPQLPGVRVQLAAFTDSAAAYSEWDALVTKWPDLLGKRRPEISKVDAAGRVMWRLRTGPFPGVAEANAFCGKLRDRGADCSIAAF